MNDTHNVTDESPRIAGGLTRELLLSGALPAMIARSNPEVRLLSDAERRASLMATLAERPEHGTGLWLFAYGSLIWNPAIHIVEERLARAVGWRRGFCLSTKSGRGTPDNPGVMLGLQQGGACLGAILRVAENAIETELDLLWRREMVADGYIPRWVEVESDDGAPIGHAIAFTINPSGPAYCGGLPEDDVVHRLATASGGLGTAAEYLFRTRDGLRAMGIEDPFVEHLSTRVTAKLNTRG